jgi:hypothetical protein
MKTFLLPLLVAGLVLAGCTTTTKPANGVTADAVTVEFTNPDTFRDIRDSLAGTVDENAVATLRAYLKDNAPAHLQSGQKLRVTFTDIDLAGDFVPGVEAERIRLVKAIYIPRQEFSFVVTDAAGKVVKEGKRTLTDLDFQMNVSRIGSDQPYFYDKILLEEWLRKEFK